MARRHECVLFDPPPVMDASAHGSTIVAEIRTHRVPRSSVFDVHFRSTHCPPTRTRLAMNRMVAAVTTRDSYDYEALSKHDVRG
jgi:hypothetical protein